MSERIEVTAMAWARITHRWPDGTEIEMEVGTDEAAFPDVLAELVHECTRLFRVTCQDER